MLPTVKQPGQAGSVHSLWWIYLRLRKACKKASLNISSDIDGDMHITLRVQISGPGQGYQAPRRGWGASPRVRRVAPAAGPSPSSLVYTAHSNKLKGLYLYFHSGSNKTNFNAYLWMLLLNIYIFF